MCAVLTPVALKCSARRCFALSTFPPRCYLVAGYDGGDCCACTCTSGPKYDCVSSDFACVDPGASCLEEMDGGNVVLAECVPDVVANGDCDLKNNNEECGALRARTICERAVDPVKISL